VHPGYGFLSERAAFAKALADAGIVFIGPNPKASRRWATRSNQEIRQRRQSLDRARLSRRDRRTPEHAARIADEIGYPVMIKASAGGGGKACASPIRARKWRRDLRAPNRKPSLRSGDDPRVRREVIVNPRHIEIQVLGDKHGNVIYLGERECSIQRRNQKVIEEAPSPVLDEATRKKMGEQRAARQGGQLRFRRHGRVRSRDRNRSFFFLEMNTRLQVEHR